jgi:hypothetical protein
LPAKVGNLIDSVRAFVPLKETAGQITEGQNAGMLQCSAVLRKATGLVDFITKRDAYTGAYTLVLETVSTKLQEVLVKCNLASIEAFKAKYNRVFAAIASWEFADVPWWLAEDHVSTGPQPSELKHIEQSLSAYPTTLCIVEDLHAMGDKLTWATDDQRRGLTDAKVSLNNADKLVQEVSILLGCMVITNSILSDSDVEASKTYVTSKLKVALQRLPVDLEGEARRVQPRRRSPRARSRLRHPRPVRSPTRLPQRHFRQELRRPRVPTRSPLRRFAASLASKQQAGGRGMLSLTQSVSDRGGQVQCTSRLTSDVLVVIVIGTRGPCV